MTDEDLKQFLEVNKAEIQAEVKKTLITNLIEKYRWNVSEQITTAVNDFVAKEIVPEVKKHLQDNKGPILEAALKGASEVGNELAKGMSLLATKNVTSDTYRFARIMEAIFK